MACPSVIKTWNALFFVAFFIKLDTSSFVIFHLFIVFLFIICSAIGILSLTSDNVNRSPSFLFSDKYSSS